MNKIKLGFSFIAIIITFLIIGYLTYNLAEPKAYDFMTRNFLTQKLPFDKFKKNTGSDDIVIVLIDTKSAEKYRWPWKREITAKIFKYFKYAKPKLIVYDAIITTMDKDNPSSDKILYNTLNTFDNLIIGFLPRVAKSQNTQEAIALENFMAKHHSLKVVDKTTHKSDLYESLMPFPKPFLNASKNIGSAAISPGFINGNISNGILDNVHRNMEYILHYKGYYYPSFALKAYLLLNNNPEIILTNKSIKIPEKNFEIKHTKTYFQIISPIKFYKKNRTGFSHKIYSAIDIIESYEALAAGKKPKINVDEFKDKIVLVGAFVPTAEGVNDNKPTPISANHPGVDIQATSIDNVIHNDFLKITPIWLNTLITIVGMLLIYIFIRINNLAKSISSALTIIFSYLLLSATCFYLSIVINVITPIVMFVLTTILAYTHKFVLENRSKEKVKSAMGKYMSQDVMKRVIQDIDNLGLGGKRANVTVLFSDIRGFTSMSEQMSPQEVSEILNEYFTEMEPIITSYNGVINKFIGDAVMAIFGEPIQDKNHAQNAVKCAYSMLKKVKELQKKWVKEGKPKIDIGVGINTGEVFVGNIGSINRMEYTVIGDTVNLASRLESYNKIYKTKLLISSTTYNEVKSLVDVIKISDVQIRGKANKMDIYEVLKVNL